MMICVPEVLGKNEVAEFRRLMDGHAWEDGRSTAGAQSADVKSNEQLPPDSELARKLGVILHRMWMEGTSFRWTKEASQAPQVARA